MKYCTNCGAELKLEAKFCIKCGEKIVAKSKIEDDLVSTSKSEDIPKKEIASKEDSKSLILINKDLDTLHDSLSIRNSQSSLSTKSYYVAAIALGILILTTQEWSPLYEMFAITLISFFVMISAIAVAFLFRSRSKKLESLINGESLIAAWDLNDKEINDYSNFLFQQERGKNKIMFFVIAVFMVIIFGAFILFMEDGKLAMLIMMITIISIIALFAFGMPYYYRNKNRSGDGRILIGAKYAYINGYFHNWDFPLSGLTKVKVISKPFKGIQFVYYYTDRTLTNTEEISIPAPAYVDLELLKSSLVQGNKKR